MTAHDSRGPCLILAHQTRVPHDIDSHDCGEAALLGHRASLAEPSLAQSAERGRSNGGCPSKRAVSAYCVPERTGPGYSDKSVTLSKRKIFERAAVRSTDRTGSSRKGFSKLILVSYLSKGRRPHELRVAAKSRCGPPTMEPIRSHAAR